MGSVADNIWRLAGAVGDIGARRDAHTRNMANLGLQSSKMKYDVRQQDEQRNYERGLGLQKRQDEELNNRPVTGRQAIMMSQLPDEAKQGLIAAAKDTSPQLLDGTVFPFGKWKEGFNTLMAQSREAKALQENKDREYLLKKRELGIKSRKADADIKKKDSRSAMYKQVQEYAKSHGITEVESWKKLLASKSEPERIRLYNNEVKWLDENVGQAERDQKIPELRKAYGIEEIEGIEKLKDEGGIPAPPPGWVKVTK